MNSHRTNIRFDQPKWMVTSGKYPRHRRRFMCGGKWNKRPPSNAFWIVGILGVQRKDARKDFDELDGELVP